MNARFETESGDHWLSRLEEAGIPAGPIFDVMQMHADPQTQAREMVPETDHPVAGRVQTIGPPIKFEATPGRVADPAPLHGQHTDDVLRELGYSDGDIESMVEQKAIRIQHPPKKEAAE